MEFLSTKEANRRIWGDLRHSFWRQRPRVWPLVILVGLLLVLIWSTACRPEPAAALTLTLAQAPAHAPVMNGVIYITEYTPVNGEYARWYKAMERCLGMTGDYAAVRWYTNPTPWRDGLHGERYTFGLWWDRHRILINLPEVHDSALVSHEMVHDILAVNHIQPGVAHPHPYFGDGPLACSAEFHE